MLFRKEKVKNTGIPEWSKMRKNIRTDAEQTQSICMRKKERKRSLKYPVLLFSPISKRILSGKVSLSTSFMKWKKASLAVETAIVMPVFFLGLVTMISFMDIYRLQTEHLSSLCQKAKETGMYAYVLEGNGAEEITLPDIYTYTPVGGLFALPKVWMYNTVKVHAWTGKDYTENVSDASDSEENLEKMVFITETGTVYHSSMDCSYLSLSILKIAGSAVESRRNDYGERYTACEICSRNQKPADSVYITKSGNSYHNLGSCSGLKRTVRLVKESETEGMHHCSRCG